MEEQEARRPRWGRLVAAVAALLVLAGLVVLWLGRKPIARNFVDRALASEGVSGQYEITRFGLRSQRLENVRIGDLARPDLTAEWVELQIGVGLKGPEVRSIAAHGVRLRGRLVDGKVSLGAIDRLLPAPSGAPFALPDIDVRLSDARMRLETPAGPVGIAIEGKGNLADGFEGRLAAVMRSLEATGCTVTWPTAFVNISVADARPALDGPVRAADIACGNGAKLVAPRAALDVSLNRRLDKWDGDAVIETGAVAYGAHGAATLGGRIGFKGTAARTQGEVSLFATGARSGEAKAERGAIDGRYVIAGKAFSLIGETQLTHASLGEGQARRIRASLAAAGGTPVGPVADAIGVAFSRAAADLNGRGTVALVNGPRGGAVRIERIDLNSGSGARVVMRSGAGRGGLSWYWPSGRARLDGELLLAGGGLPGGRIGLRQPRADLAMSGEARFAPYRVGDASIAFTPVVFGPGGGAATRFSTRVTMSGPIGEGRVEALSLPLSGLVGSNGSFLINPACAPLDFERLAIAGMELGRNRIPLCPNGDALLARRAGQSLRGGALIASPRLTGRVGDSPLSIAARALGVEVGRPGFRADAVAVRLGTGEDVTRLDLARVAGDVSAGGIGGRFEGAAGKIGAVPLLLSEGAGDWGFAGGVLTLGGGLRVADSVPDPRFNPMISRDVRLKLAGGVIEAAGSLNEPVSGTRVTQVTLRHDLSSGKGDAMLDVPGLSFVKGFQPELLTRLTLGVVANVEGTLAGRGTIRWNPAGVTSGGTFHTDALNFAAAFGPVTGLKGEIHFSDLLALETPPGQVATLAEVNPGIAVTGGTIRYQLLQGQKVRIEGGQWPFSGGELLLEPTVMDFGQPVARSLTFRVAGMDAAQFVQQFDFKNISVTGTFDGTLPMIFDEQGGRITGGRLVVRKGGGTLAYVGELSNEQLGTFGKLAFDALKSVRYDSLAIELNGSLDGEIVSRVLFDGVNEAPLTGAGPGMMEQLTGLPFRFNITITAPFRGLINSAQSLTDPRGLIGQALPPRGRLPGSTPVQPPESTVRP